MSDVLLVTSFLVGAGVSLATSWLLVTRLERIGASFGLSEALLGMLAALAADSPEITSAVTALAGGHERIGAGVAIGSNVFNLAALLGLGAIAAGRIVLHRRVLLFEGFVAALMAATTVAVVVAGLPPAAGVLVCAVVLVPYMTVSSGPSGQRWLPGNWRDWLSEAVAEEELELAGALDLERPHRGDMVVAIIAVLVVIGASIAMEQAGSTLGTRYGIPEIVIGGLVLAAVTSLPNAVSAIYLARRGRGAATLSIALNSNALNVLVGLLLPAVFVGLEARSGETALITVWYAGFTVAVLGLALVGRGLGRASGIAIVLAYAAFVITLTVST
jgi:cation:H+ antiporter